MKRFLTSLGVMMMLCLVCISCKKDDPTNYPADLKGIWAGANASTGYTCNVLFTTNSSTGAWCTISLANADKKKTATFDGRFAYDQSAGIASFTSENDGAPVASIQYSEDGKELLVTIKSTATDYGQYILQQITYPSSIAGSWGGKDENGNKYTATIAPYSANGGTPISISNESIPTLNGTCNYNAATGTATAKVAFMGFEIKYDINTNTLGCDIEGMGKITFERLATAK